MNIQIKLAIIAIIVVISLASLAVSQVNFDSAISTTDNSKLQIVTSAGFLHEFSQNIGKEKINSTLLIPMGVNPHDWEPTIRDTENLLDCPDYWGGYEFKPFSIEFWEGNDFRLNKRNLYVLENGEWKNYFLEP